LELLARIPLSNAYAVLATPSVLQAVLTQAVRPTAILQELGLSNGSSMSSLAEFETDPWSARGAQGRRCAIEPCVLWRGGRHPCPRPWTSTAYARLGLADPPPANKPLVPYPIQFAARPGDGEP
jgi:hypothetical protein